MIGFDYAFANVVYQVLIVFFFFAGFFLQCFIPDCNSVDIRCFLRSISGSKTEREKVDHNGCCDFFQRNIVK